jgi:hypothetical protein
MATQKHTVRPLARLILAAAKNTTYLLDTGSSLHSPSSAKRLWRNEAGGLDPIQHAEMEWALPIGRGLVKELRQQLLDFT